MLFHFSLENSWTQDTTRFLDDTIPMNLHTHDVVARRVTYSVNMPANITLAMMHDSVEEIDPQLIRTTLDEGAATNNIVLLDALYDLMEHKLYPGEDSLTDDEHTEVAWALEDGAYSVSRILRNSPLFNALLGQYNGDEHALVQVLPCAIIDDCAGDLYTLASREEMMEAATTLLSTSSYPH